LFSASAGGQAAAFLHLARAVCRRAERSVILLVSQGACEEGVAVYLNRLSDYLFTVARIASRKAQQPETIYKKA
jgi:cob(I)alamin adenosyltransferase